MTPVAPRLPDNSVDVHDRSGPSSDTYVVFEPLVWCYQRRGPAATPAIGESLLVVGPMALHRVRLVVRVPELAAVSSGVGYDGASVASSEPGSMRIGSSSSSGWTTWRRARIRPLNGGVTRNTVSDPSAAASMAATRSVALIASDLISVGSLSMVESVCSIGSALSRPIDRRPGVETVERNRNPYLAAVGCKQLVGQW